MNESASICKEKRLSMILCPIYCENIYIEAYDSMPIYHDSTLYLVALKIEKQKVEPSLSHTIRTSCLMRSMRVRYFSNNKRFTLIHIFFIAFLIHFPRLSSTCVVIW